MLCEVRSPSEDPAETQNTHVKEFSTWALRPVNIENNGPLLHCEDEVEEETVPSRAQSRPAAPNLDWMEFNEMDTPDLTGLLSATLAPTSHQAKRRYSSPTILRIPSPEIPDYEPCEVWKKANAIYAKIFDFDRQRIAEADQFDSGSLVRVVKDGWESLSLGERSNPIFEILREVDEFLFWDLDPVTKVANLYKSMLILKVCFLSGV